MRIKIIHVQLLPLMSGVQKVCFDELVNLDEENFDRIVICKSEGEFTEKLKRAGIEIHLIPELERDISPLNDLMAFFKTYSFFTNQKPDIVHTHSSKTGIIGRFAARLAGVPRIFHTVHGFSFSGELGPFKARIFKFLELLAAKITNKLIVLNRSDEFIASTTLKVPRDRIVLLPNGVDTENFKPAAFENRIQIRREYYGVDLSEKLIVCMIGRLWRQKNPECFIKAAISVLKVSDDINFFIIGDGELRGAVDNMIIESGYKDNIKILGWRRDIPILLKGADVMVLPSRWEGMPLAIIEAMASGVPVVASDIPGNNHLIQNRGDGFLFPLDDVDALSKIILQLSGDCEMRMKISANAREKVLLNFTLSDRVDRIKKIYYSK
jgi:glycosyltransferase involved in cell wall biosynthesis